MNVLRRHALARLREAPEAHDADDRERARRWQEAGRPFVITRRRVSGDAVGLGFCTTQPDHPELRPRRVAAHAPAALVTDMILPPLLEDVARCPPALRLSDSFGRLSGEAKEANVTVRVYGSWMWQLLTGERHVDEASDLDVLIDVADIHAAGRAASFLAAVEPSLAFRLDGELSFDGLGEVNWREYRQDRSEVLLKSIDVMKLVSRRDLPQ